MMVTLFFFAGCAAVYYPDPTAVLVEQGRGFHHTVQRGETLWGIAQTYQADIDQIILLNNIENVEAIRSGQRIFIPSGRSIDRTPRVSDDIRVDAGSRAGIRRDIVPTDAFAWPSRAGVLSYFNSRDAGFLDQGIRIRASSDSRVAASRSGKVIFVDYLAGYGQTVILDHTDGFMTVYAGNALITARVGDTVHQGDTIAMSSGSDGFVYFEIRRNGTATNPLFYLPKG